MTFRSERPRRRPSCQFEFLESRSLLSAGLSAAGAEVHVLATPSKTHTIRSTVRGTITAIASNSLGSGTFSLVAGRPLGGFSAATLVQTATVIGTRRRLTWSISNAQAVADSSTGTVNLTYSGTGKLLRPNFVRLRLAGTITGGTGAFAGATGHMKASGLLNFTPTSSGTFAGTVVLTYKV